MQYFTCKHDKYIVIKKISCPSDITKQKWLEKRKCEICDKEYYSDYFYEYGSERHYTKN